MMAHFVTALLCMHSRRRQKESGDDRDEKQDEACEAEALRVRIRFLLRKAVGMRLDRFIIRIRNQSPVVGRKVLRIRRRFLLEEPEDRRQEGEVILLEIAVRLSETRPFSAWPPSCVFASASLAILSKNSW